MLGVECVGLCVETVEVVDKCVGCVGCVGFARKKSGPLKNHKNSHRKVNKYKMLSKTIVKWA